MNLWSHKILDIALNFFLCLMVQATLHMWTLLRFTTRHTGTVTYCRCNDSASGSHPNHRWLVATQAAIRSMKQGGETATMLFSTATMLFSTATMLLSACRRVVMPSPVARLVRWVMNLEGDELRQSGRWIPVGRVLIPAGSKTEWQWEMNLAESGRLTPVGETDGFAAFAAQPINYWVAGDVGCCQFRQGVYHHQLQQLLPHVWPAEELSPTWSSCVWHSNNVAS